MHKNRTKLKLNNIFCFLSQAVDLGRQLFSTRKHLVFRFFKVFVFVSILTIIITLANICHLSVKDLLVSCLAFLPTGWGLILVPQMNLPLTVSKKNITFTFL